MWNDGSGNGAGANAGSVNDPAEALQTEQQSLLTGGE